MSSVMKNFCLCVVLFQIRVNMWLDASGPGDFSACYNLVSWRFLIGSLQKKNIKKVLLQFLFTISIISWEIIENLSVCYYTRRVIIFGTELL